MIRQDGKSLHRWNEAWRINGLEIQCNRCGMAQHRRHIGKPFVHAKACPLHAIGVQMPWRDLQDLLHSIFGRTE